VATRVGGQIDLNSPVRQTNVSQSNDVWVTQPFVIDEWGLGEADLWQRLVDRHNEILVTGGIHTLLWRQLDTGLPCTCEKSETGQVNSRCPVCSGTGWVGGYQKFGFDTSFFAANTPGLMLHDLVVAQKSPWQFELPAGKDTGYVLSPLFQVTQSLGFAGFQASGFDGIRKLTQDNIKVEYSTNEVDFFDFGTLDPLNEPALNIRYKITLTRNADKTSPFFTILRARWQMQQDTAILISKRSFPEQRWLESFGVRVKLDGITWWTTPNLGIMGQTPILLEEDDIFEIVEGAYKPQSLTQEEFPVSGRFKPSNVTYVEPKGRFLSQRFNIRMLQRDEPELAVF
jgi:hypothetical protein